MINKSAVIAALMLVITGCTTSSTLYDWGNYEDNLFNYYHKPAIQDAILVDHLAFLDNLERNNKRPAPGLLAEAGTFLLLKGDTQKAIEFYQKEYDTWPESQAMMSTLITNLKERE